MDEELSLLKGTTSTLDRNPGRRLHAIAPSSESDASHPSTQCKFERQPPLNPLSMVAGDRDTTIVIKLPPVCTVMPHIR